MRLQMRTRHRSRFRFVVILATAGYNRWGYEGDAYSTERGSKQLLIDGGRKCYRCKEFKLECSALPALMAKCEIENSEGH